MTAQTGWVQASIFSYRDGLSCVWYIQPASVANSLILLTFSSLQTEAGVDIVSVYNGLPTGSPAATYSGSTVPSSAFVSAGTSISVTFLANSNGISGSGFVINYETVAMPTVSAVSPAGGQGGTLITIDGTRFGSVVADLAVTVGGLSCTGVTILVDTTRLRCQAPSASSNGLRDVVVTYRGVRSVTPNLQFRYIATPTISDVTPAGGLSGQVVTISGTLGLQDGSTIADFTVTVNGTTCGSLALVSSSPEMIRCTMPAIVASEASIPLVVRRFGVSSASFSWLVIASPTVSTVAPPVFRSGTEITITGSNFGSLSSAISVSIGGQACSSINLVSSSQVRCFAPALSLGMQTVNLTRYLVAAFSNQQIESVLLPNVTAISPAGGTTGQLLTISGSGFGTLSQRGGLSVTLGGQICPVSLASGSSSTIYCTVPLLTVGPAALSLTFYTLSGVVSASPFQFVLVASLTSVNPVGGGVVGSTLNIVGAGFGINPAAFALFVGGQSCPLVSGSLSDSSAQCLLPNLGINDLTYVNCSIYGIPCTNTLTYNYAVPTISSLTPAGGGGGATVTLVGDFGIVQSLSTISVSVASAGQCTGLNVTLSNPSQRATQIRCTMPNSASFGLFDVTVVRFGAVSAPQSFRYVNPVLTSVAPLGGVVSTVLTLGGSDFGSTLSEVSVIVGFAPCSLVNGTLSATSVRCVLQAGNPVGSSNAITLTRFGVQTTFGTFLQLAPLTLASISPLGGAAGDLLTLSGFFGNTSSCQNSEFSVLIDGVLCPITSVASSCNEVKCSVPVLSPGTRSVILSRFTSFSNSLPYQYVSPPVLLDVTPPSGVVYMPITLLGSGFGTVPTALSVTVATLTVPVLRCNNTALVITAPLQPESFTGLASLVVRLYTVASTELVTFTYVTPPLISGISPAGGRAGTVITISGSSFGTSQSSLTARVGGVICPLVPLSLTVNSISSIACTVPANGGAIGTVQVTLELLGFKNGAIDFSYIDVPVVVSVSPSEGKAGDVVEVVANLSNSVSLVPEAAFSVTIGDNPCATVPESLVLEVSQATISCTVPPGVIGAQNVGLSLYQISDVGVRPTFTYVDAISIFALSPPAGQAGTRLTILGGGMGSNEAALDIRIGGASCPVITGSASSVGIQVACTVPSGAVGPASLTIARGTGNVTVSPINFIYIQTPNVTSFSPRGGQGGILLTIAGSSFGSDSSALSVTVGVRPCSIVSANASSITCILPANAVGIYDIALSLYQISGIFSTNTKTIQYVDTPAVISLSPSVGRLSSPASPITLTGRGFGLDPSVVSVDFGGSSCVVDASTFSNTVLTCLPTLTPPTSTSDLLIPVTVQIFVVRSAATVSFKNIAKPVINSIAPFSGGLAGDIITINGTGFGPSDREISVTVGGFTAILIAGSLAGDGTRVAIVAPASVPVGRQNIVLSRSGVRSDSNVTFEYVLPPVVSVISPAGGLPGTRVTIFGSGFGFDAAALSVKFGAASVCGSLNLVSASEIRCTAASSPLGAQPVSVQRYTAVNLAPRPTFTYANVPSVSSINPAGGEAPLTVTISGTNFGSDSSVLSVTIGATACSSITLNSAGTTLRCNLVQATGQGVGVFPVSVVRFGLASSEAIEFEFVAPPVLNAIVPEGGKANDIVTLRGSGFRLSMSVTVGGAPCPVVALQSNSSITCRVPDGFGTATVRASIFNSLSPVIFFEYAQPPILRRVTPLGGQSGSRLTITGSRFGADLSTIAASVGETDCAIISLSQETIVCELPSTPVLAAGARVVTVTRFGTVQNTQPSLSFLIVDKPVVSGLSPPGGLSGSEITISGQKFGSDESAVRVNIASASASGLPGTLNSVGTEFALQVPNLDAETPGLLPLTVQRFDVLSDPVNFLFIEAPVLESLSPLGGVVGSAVTLQGNFGPVRQDLSAAFGSAPCAIDMSVAYNGSQLVCSVPAGLGLGLHMVTVSRFGISAENLVPFLHINPPDVFTLNPPVGQAGSRITVTGSGFLADVSVRFAFPTGDVIILEVPSGDINGDQTQFEIVAPTPPSGFLGLANFSVIVFETEQATAETWRYVPSPTILSIYPRGGANNEILTITGSAFGDIESAIEIFVGSRPCPLILESLTPESNGTQMVSCKAQMENLGPAAVSMRVSSLVAQGGAFSFEFSAVPTIITLEVLPPEWTPSCSTDASCTSLSLWRELVPEAQRGGGSAGQRLMISGTNFGSLISELRVTVLDGLAECTLIGAVTEDPSTQYESVVCILPLLNVTDLVEPAVCEAQNAVDEGAYLVSIVLSHFALVSEPKSLVYLTSVPASNALSPLGLSLESVRGTSVSISGINYGSCVGTVSGLLGQGGQLQTLDIDESSLSTNSEGSFLSAQLPPKGCGDCECSQCVRVRRYASVSEVCTTQFSYRQKPVLARLWPVGGSEGSVLTLQGSFFGSVEADLTIEIGEAGKVCVMIPNSLQISSLGSSNQTNPDCVASFGSPTPSDIQTVQCTVHNLTQPGMQIVSIVRSGISSEDFVQFAFVNPPQLVALSPAGGLQGTLLRLDGRGFGSSEAVLGVEVGGVDCPLVNETLNAVGSHVECIVQATIAPPADLDVVVSLFNVTSETALTFRLIEPVTVSSIYPQGGQQGQILTLTGSGFGSQSEMTVMIGESECLVEAATPTEVQCRILETRQGSVDVTVFRFEVPATISDSAFEFVSAPILNAVSPKGGVGGTRITLTGRDFGTSAEAVGVVLSRSGQSARCPVVLTELQVSGTTEQSVVCVLPKDFPLKGLCDVAVTRFETQSSAIPAAFRVVLESDLVYVRSSDPLGAFLIAVAVIGIVITCASTFAMHKHRANPMIKSLSPGLSYLILLGIVVGFVEVIISTGKPTDALCVARVWVGALSFSLILSNLLAKTWRIWRLFDNKTLQRLQITDTYLLKAVAVLLAIHLAGVFTWSVRDPPQPNVLFGSPSVYRCWSPLQPLFVLGQQAWEFSNMAAGVWLCWMTRNVQSRFNESRDFAFSIYNYFFVSVIIVPLSLLLPPGSPEAFAVEQIGHLLILFTIVTLLFAKKLLALSTNKNHPSAIPETKTDSASLASQTWDSKAMSTTAVVAAHDDVHLSVEMSERKQSVTQWAR
eukprot:TRINITY_DN2298_c0_g1_i4.p1 TRINITY_DN2298_c0_g1~~TRINITY_DN2298_c0_g1_i4.p1  ORF type:complete len:3426 (-),score=677.36 TRINITY_DN2298_c0_g1_i4:52-9360(-)